MTLTGSASGDDKPENEGVVLSYALHAASVVGNESGGTLRVTEKERFDEFAEIDPAKSAPWRYDSHTAYNFNLMPYMTVTYRYVESTQKHQGFMALGVEISHSGDYEMSILPYGYNTSGIADIYLIPYTENVSQADFADTEPVGTVDFYQNQTKWSPGTVTDVGRVTVPKAGEYLLILNMSGKNSDAQFASLVYNSLGLSNMTLTAVAPEEENRITGVSLSAENTILTAGGTTQATATISYLGGTSAPGNSLVDFSSSNEDVATVDAAGRLPR